MLTFLRENLVCRAPAKLLSDESTHFYYHSAIPYIGNLISDAIVDGITYSFQKTGSPLMVGQILPVNTVFLFCSNEVKIIHVAESVWSMRYLTKKYRELKIIRIILEK